MKIKIIKSLKNIKFPKVLIENNKIYIYGLYEKKINNLTKFDIKLHIYDFDFNFEDELIYELNKNKSCLIWDIKKVDDYYIFFIEYKSIDSKIHSNQNYKYYIKKEELIKFNYFKKECLELDDHLYFGKINNINLTSQISIDKENINYYWGKYLFKFYENKKSYTPKFDNIVNYNEDRGHLIHNVERVNGIYNVLISIRKKNDKGYKYDIIESKTEDFKKFYDTKYIDIINNLSLWCCYPCLFKMNNKKYMILNQDDFGKEKEILLGEIIK